jgi:hypothetical protein
MKKTLALVGLLLMVVALLTAARLVARATLLSRERVVLAQPFQPISPPHDFLIGERVVVTFAPTIPDGTVAVVNGCHVNADGTCLVTFLGEDGNTKTVSVAPQLLTRVPLPTPDPEISYTIEGLDEGESEFALAAFYHNRKFFEPELYARLDGVVIRKDGALLTGNIGAGAYSGEKVVVVGHPNGFNLTHEFVHIVVNRQIPIVVNEGMAVYVYEVEGTILPFDSNNGWGAITQAYMGENSPQLREERMGLEDEAAISRYGALTYYSAVALHRLNEAAAANGIDDFVRRWINASLRRAEEVGHPLTIEEMIEVAERIWPGCREAIEAQHVLFVRSPS